MQLRAPKLQYPLGRGLKSYSLAKLKSDIKAGVSVSLLDFPQGMAYALIAGFPVAFGVFASAVASLVGPLAGASRYVMMGPTNATAVLVLSAFLTHEFTPEEKLIALPILLFLVGIAMILGSLLKVATVIQYVSRSVIAGYITAAALLIIVNQINKLLGITIPSEATFFEVLERNIEYVGNLDGATCIVSAVTLGFFLLFKYGLKDRLPTVVLTVILGALAGNFLIRQGYELSMLSGIQAKNWNFKFPSLSFEMVHVLGSAAVAVAFLAILESTSIAKTLAARAGDTININQQVFSLGMANMASSVSSGMPISGSLTRSTLNFEGGSKTPVSNIVSGCMLILGILFIGPFVAYIPEAVLAALVLMVGISLINWRQIRIIIRSTPGDAGVFALTLCTGLLFPLDIAIYVGAAASIILFLRKVSQPQLVEYAFNDMGELIEKAHAAKKEDTPEISIVHIEGELFFGSTDIFLNQTRLLCEDPNLKVIILRMRNAHDLDATSAMAIADLAEFARKKGSQIILSGANPGVKTVLENSKLMSHVGTENFFPYCPENPNLSTRNALKRAQQIIGSTEANIILFTAPHKDSDQPAPNPGL